MKLHVDALDAETVPDGTFGGARLRGGARPPTTPWTPEQQQQHRETLLAAVSRQVRPSPTGPGPYWPRRVDAEAAESDGASMPREGA